jgi:hypothetical protein
MASSPNACRGDTAPLTFCIDNSKTSMFTSGICIKVHNRPAAAQHLKWTPTSPSIHTSISGAERRRRQSKEAHKKPRRDQDIKNNGKKKEKQENGDEFRYI